MLPERLRDRRERADDEHDAARVDQTGRPLIRDEHVRQRQRRAGHETGEERNPRAGPVHQRSLPEEVLGQLLVAAEQVVREHVRPNLFRGPRLDEQIAEIFTLPFLGRLLVEELVELRRDAPLENQRQHRGDDREQDEHVVKARQERGHQHDRDDVAGKP